MMINNLFSLKVYEIINCIIVCFSTLLFVCFGLLFILEIALLNRKKKHQLVFFKKNHFYLNKIFRISKLIKKKTYSKDFRLFSEIDLKNKLQHFK